MEIKLWPEFALLNGLNSLKKGIMTVESDEREERLSTSHSEEMIQKKFEQLYQRNHYLTIL